MCVGEWVGASGTATHEVQPFAKCHSYSFVSHCQCHTSNHGVALLLQCRLQLLHLQLRVLLLVRRNLHASYTQVRLEITCTSLQAARRLKRTECCQLRNAADLVRFVIVCTHRISTARCCFSSATLSLHCCIAFATARDVNRRTARINVIRSCLYSITVASQRANARAAAAMRNRAVTRVKATRAVFCSDTSATHELKAPPSAWFSTLRMTRLTLCICLFMSTHDLNALATTALRMRNKSLFIVLLCLIL
jgi:hypothetical protein